MHITAGCTQSCCGLNFVPHCDALLGGEAAASGCDAYYYPWLRGGVRTFEQPLHGVKQRAGCGGQRVRPPRAHDTNQRNKEETTTTAKAHAHTLAGPEHGGHLPDITAMLHTPAGSQPHITVLQGITASHHSTAGHHCITSQYCRASWVW